MRITPDEQDLIDEGLIAAFQRHLADQDLSPATIRAYCHDLKLFKEWLVEVHGREVVSLRQVGIADLVAFQKHLVKEKSQKPTTVNRRVQCLRLFFRWLQAEDWIAADPASELRFLQRSAAQKPTALTHNEVISLLRTADSSPHGMAKRNTALVQLMLQTGLRVGETTAVTHEDLQIREQSGSVRIRKRNHHGEREVPLNTTARKALKIYVETCPPVSSETQVFLSKRGTPMAVRSVQETVAKLGEKAGIKRTSVSAHTLRHTFAVNYLKSNPGKLVELANLLGHESVETTAIYTQPAAEDLAEELERSLLNMLEA